MKSYRIRAERESAESFGVQSILAVLKNGSLSPAAPMSTLMDAQWFKDEGDAIASMMHACRIMTEEWGQTLVLTHNQTNEMLLTIDCEPNVDLKNDIEPLVRQAMLKYRAKLSIDDGEFFQKTSVNLERMPRHNYSPSDGKAISRYAEYIVSWTCGPQT